MLNILETLIAPNETMKCHCINLGLHGNPLDLNNPCLPCI